MAIQFCFLYFATKNILYILRNLVAECDYTASTATEKGKHCPGSFKLNKLTQLVAKQVLFKKF